MSYQLDEESFLKDVANHQMVILREDGVYRHIRFKRPNTGCYHFDLVTYPGYLVYFGDMGCYVFSRLEDMFDFFRMGKNDWNHNPSGLSINPGYWSEKLLAVDGGRNAASATEFDEEKFRQAVMGDLVSWVRSHKEETTKEERRELWDSVVSDVIEAESDRDGIRQTIAAHDFHHRVSKRAGDFYFQDFWEHNLTRYTHSFIWCCYALAWSIQRYDEAKKTTSFPESRAAGGNSNG